MNFFKTQHEARKTSNRLLLVFILAVIVITCAVTLSFYLVFGHHEEGQSLFSAVTLSDNFTLISASGIFTILFISGASMFRMASLSSGGGQVARDLGGDRVSEDVSDPQLKQLRNVVEEIAIASGVPVPEIYVLEQESAINAFAAGHHLHDAAVAVTRGTLENLSRDELQGVIAHEFSHILNGDMRLNIRLLGLLFGITAIALLGRKVLYHFRFAAGGSRRGGGGVMLVALLLLAIGSIGLFFARWIKAAISRQRETLADASAVQFTRNPQGIAGALKKIAAYGSGSILMADSEEVDHMLFSNGRIERMFATHPPLVERIQAIEPGFQAGELQRIAANLKQQKLAKEAQASAHQEAAPGRSVHDPFSIMEGIGQPQWQQILYASVLAQAIPDNLSFSARSPQKVVPLLLYLLLSQDNEQREAQLLAISRHGGEALETQTRSLHQLWGNCSPEQRIPLLEMAMPALKRRPRRELIEYFHLFDEISPKDGKAAVFPFMLSRMLHLYLEESLQLSRAKQGGRLSIQHCLDEIALVYAVLATFENNLHPADHAYEAGISTLQPPKPIPFHKPQKDWADAITAALTRLDHLNPDAKQQFVKGLLAIIFNDREVNVDELELTRAICATLHVPLPPIEVSSAGA